MSLISTVGRALLAAPFVVLGYEAAAEPGPRVQLAADLGVPQPELAVRVNGAAMTLGGVALALGIWPRTAAAGLVASMVPTTVAGHAYWKMDDPMQRKVNRIQVLKNVGLVGGLVAIAGARALARGDEPHSDA
ncbi:MAG: DoxX family protein [Nitriliruptoraceae bacterium]|nr:DoxX family protein [Nitriliruptoraceae bacterium]